MRNFIPIKRKDKLTAPEAYHDLRTGLEPTIFIIFGVTGNLAQRRLLPALYHLIKDNLLHKDTEIIGISRRPITANDIINEVELCVLETDKICDTETLAGFKQRLRTFQLDPVNESDYDRLRHELDNIEAKHGVCMNRVFYLSIPPQVYEPIIDNLGTQKLNTGCAHGTGKTRLLVEKPFGYDLASAHELIEHTRRFFSEEQVFRIDHYLAKETAQNILIFRKHNPIFSAQWDKQHITSLNLTFHEQIGIEGRGEFYDNVGALRDVVQNHLLQLLALATMELPTSLHDSNAMHRAKQQLLADIKVVDVNKAHVVRGQYRGYQEEVNNIGSTTETYVKLNLSIDNKRWQGVPITVSAGKALKAKQVAVTATFSERANDKNTNTLTFRIQPNEGIDVELGVKRPGFEDKIETVRMDFSYHGVFSEPDHPDAYERVLVDAIKGDHTLFATSSEVLEAWRILQPILTSWELDTSDLIVYEPNSNGPVAAEGGPGKHSRRRNA